MNENEEEKKELIKEYPYVVLMSKWDRSIYRPSKHRWMHHILQITAIDEQGRLFEQTIKQARRLSKRDESLLGIDNNELTKGKDLKAVLLSFKRFLGDRLVIGDFIETQFGLIREWGDSLGIPFGNRTINIEEIEARVHLDSKKETIKGNDYQSDVLSRMKIIEKAFLRGSYFDGKNTYTAYIGNHGSLVGHGDIRTYADFFCTNDFRHDMEWLSTEMNRLGGSILDKVKTIYEVSDPLGKRLYYFSSTDKENDFLHNGHFAIDSEPDLKRIGDSEGFAGFSEWEYRIVEVFANNISDSVVEDYLSIYKHQGFVF